MSYKLLLAEKDKQIDLLKDQIADLKQRLNAYMYPPEYNPSNDTNLLESQLKKVEIKELSKAELEDLRLAQLEAEKMLTGELIEE